MGISYFLTHHM